MPSAAPSAQPPHAGPEPREPDGFPDPACPQSELDHLGVDHARNERRTWMVAGLCLLMLLAQLVGGALFRSMALTASGLHMAAHVAVLLTAAAGYWLGRRWAGDPRFAFGAGKIGYLAGFANAVVLAATALGIGLESVERLFAPEAVDYRAAIPLAGAGLVVNLVCVWLLRPARRGERRHHHDEDLNLSAAHLHLSADAIISVFTIVGLEIGRAFGWRFVDPLLGLAGAGLVAQFALSLIRRAGGALLDVHASPALAEEIRRRLEGPDAQVLDLRLWRLGPGRHAAVAVVGAASPFTAETYRARLKDLPGLSHLTIEVRRGAAQGPN